MTRTAILISDEIRGSLPLYCKSMQLAEKRVESVLTQLGADVVHVKTYDLHEPMTCPLVEIVVVVSLQTPHHLIKQIQVRFILVNLESKMTLYEALRPRNMECIRKIYRQGSMDYFAAKKAYLALKDPMPFETAFELAHRRGYLEAV